MQGHTVSMQQSKGAQLGPLDAKGVHVLCALCAVPSCSLADAPGVTDGRAAGWQRALEHPSPHPLFWAHPPTSAREHCYLHPSLCPFFLCPWPCQGHSFTTTVQRWETRVFPS